MKFEGCFHPQFGSSNHFCRFFDDSSYNNIIQARIHFSCETCLGRWHSLQQYKEEKVIIPFIHYHHIHRHTIIHENSIHIHIFIPKYVYTHFYKLCLSSSITTENSMKTIPSIQNGITNRHVYLLKSCFSLFIIDVYSCLCVLVLFLD